MTIEVLYFDGCPNHEALLPHLHELLATVGVHATIALRRDVDPGSDARDDYGMKCRLYATDEGIRGTPPDAWILNALGPQAQ